MSDLVFDLLNSVVVSSLRWIPSDDNNETVRVNNKVLAIVFDCNEEVICGVYGVAGISELMMYEGIMRANVPDAVLALYTVDHKEEWPLPKLMWLGVING